MAIKARNLGSSGGATDALLRQLAEQYGQQAAPKVNPLGRILAPITGIGSILDAYYDAKFREQNAGILNVLKNYGLNIGQGFATLATGKSYEEEGRMEQLTDILEKTDPAFKYSAVGKSPILRTGIDIAAGILSDPLTYATFGLSSLTDDVLKAGLKATGLTDDVVKGIVPKLAGSNIDEATRFLMSNFGDDVADSFAVNVLSEASKQGLNLKSGSLKVLGKTVTESPKAVKGAKAFVSPLGLAMEEGGKVMRKVTPETYFNVKNIFDPVGAASEMGRTDVAELMRKFQRETGGVQRKAAADIVDSGVYDAYKALGDTGDLGKLIESGRRLTPSAQALETVQKKKPELRKLLEEHVARNVSEVGEKEFLTSLRDIFPEEAVARDDELLKALSLNVGTQDRQLLDVLYDKVESFAKSGKGMTDEAVESALDDVVDILSKKALRESRAKTDIIMKGGQQELFPEVASTLGNITDEQQKFLDKYFTLQRDMSRKLEAAGFDTISEFDMGYVARGKNIKGYKPNFIETVLARDVSQDSIDNILSSKKVQRELADSGFVKRETLEKLLIGENKGVLSQYDQGMLEQLLTGGGDVKGRVFDTIREAEKAGVVYGDDWLNTLVEQTARQKEQLLAKNFVDELIKVSDDAGNPLFRPEPEGIFRERVVIPGAKGGEKGAVLYTDKVTRKIADDLISKFTNTNDLDQLLTGFDKVMQVWKGWVTAKGPRFIPYHMRNAFDDTVRMVVGGADPMTLVEDHLAAIEVMQFDDLVRSKGIEGALKEFDAPHVAKMYEELGLKADAPIKDLWLKTLDNGVLADITKTGAESGLTRDLLEEGGKKITASQKLESYMSFQGKLTSRENVSRIAQFNNTLRKTGSVSQAVDATKRVLFNYNELSGPEKQVFKRIMPFYAFTKNNLAFYLDTLKNNPEKLARFQNVLDGLKSGTRGTYGEDWEAMPDWMKEGMALPIGKQGDTLSVLGDIGLSIGDIDETLSTEGLISKLNPFLKTLIETSTGKNVYYGEDIMNINDARAYAAMPEWFKNAIGYQEFTGKTKEGEEYTQTTMRPQTKYFLENAPGLSTMLKPIVNMSRALSGDVGAVQHLSGVFLPAKIYQQSIESAKERQEKEKYDELYKLLQKEGFAKEFQRYYIPAELQDKLLQNLQ